MEMLSNLKTHHTHSSVVQQASLYKQCMGHECVKVKAADWLWNELGKSINKEINETYYTKKY